MRVDVSRLSKEAQEQIAAKLAVTLVESSKRMERRSKYNNLHESIAMDSGEVYAFHSRREAQRYRELRLMEKAGAIRELRLQVHYTLQEAYIRSDGRKVAREEYIADFTYYEQDYRKEWVLVVEDVKGVRTRTYIHKRNAMLDKYGITIHET